MSKSDQAPPPGLILLAQPEQIGITLEEMVEALPEAYRGLPHLPVILDDLREITRQAIQTGDWPAAKRALDDAFRTRVAPLKLAHPDYRVVYFGSSPVPLAIQLGSLLATWQQVDVIPHHHHRRSWGWSAEPGIQPACVVGAALPDERDRSPGVVIIRVSTSHRVDPHLTRQAVDGDVLFELDIALERPAEDAFTCIDEMHAVAAELRRALDAVGDRFAGVYRVHLFASVQPGIAVLLGAQISETMHPAIQTYQYTRNAENACYHLPAVLVNGRERYESLPPSEEERMRAARDRELLAKDLERIRARARREKGSEAATWIASVMQRAAGHPELVGTWRYLPMLGDTPLPGSSVDLVTCAVADSFHLASPSTWQLDDHWLARLARRLPDDSERQQALRLLVLHEAAHRGEQMLTGTTGHRVGRFPKVLEEIDYHADVWAMLYEHDLACVLQEIEQPGRYFMDLIRIATETMWAFDDDGPPLEEIQIRRLNRYLNWYWQYLLLERGIARNKALPLDDVVAVLAQRPLIELAGPLTRIRDERVFFDLAAKRIRTPELAIYYRGQMHRDGERDDLSIRDLLEGARTRDGAMILDVLRAFAQLTAR